MDNDLLKKYEKLKDYMGRLPGLAVAFSSGVDSTFLLYAAKEALKDNVIAVTISSCLFPKREFDEAGDYCKKLGIRHFIVSSEELEIEGFAKNPKDRCYLCKHDLFQKIISLAKNQGIDYVAEGSNLDDNGDYRPGLKAVAELGVLSPLRAIGFTKQEIRDLSEYFNIPTYNKPSFACLASRIPYGELITKDKLNMVDRAEQLLMDLGFSQFRVRIHSDVARIELFPEEFPKFMEENVRLAVYDKFKEYGFSYVALDLKGYRTGSMNETLPAEDL